MYRQHLTDAISHIQNRKSQYWPRWPKTLWQGLFPFPLLFFPSAQVTQIHQGRILGGPLGPRPTGVTKGAPKKEREKEKEKKGQRKEKRRKEEGAKREKIGKLT